MTAQPPPEQASVLVVDDTPTNRDVMERILLRGGHRVLLATSGEQALEILETELPDLVLLDVNMPHMNGFEVCEAIKADPHTTDIPVIFVSAVAELGDKVRAFQAGAVDYILKPFKVEEVVVRVESQLTLSRQRRQILELNDLKDQLIRTVSHDLKNPLNIVLGYAALLMEQTDRPQSEQRDMVEQIYNSARKMLDLVTALLDLTHLESGQQLDMMRLDIGQMALQLMATFDMPASQKDIRLNIHLPSTPIYINGDPVRLEQVFNNLLSNAIKYTPPGGSVTLTLDANDDWVRIAVSDTGLGIPEADQANLFNKFFRVNTVEHKKQEGTGLGLSIAKAIVEQHKGAIEVRSAPGEGSTFTVHLPRFNA
ncbi:MAG: ATP-binding protein [Chloroflexota bacterium]